MDRGSLRLKLYVGRVCGVMEMKMEPPVIYVSFIFMG
jgi:hypothetical protein